MPARPLPKKRGRPRKADVDEIASLAKVLPLVLGRNVTSSEIAFFVRERITAETVRRRLVEARQIGLMPAS